MFEDSLIKAIKSYDYPPITYDFVEGRERGFASMRDLEHYLQTLLQAGTADSVRDGLSGILYWGHYRAGYRNWRVKTFREKAATEQLQLAAETFQSLRDSGLVTLKKAALPQFANMAFITKLRTFLDPEHYCVLDRKIAVLAPLARLLKTQQTYIPITRQNAAAYEWWVARCCSISSHLQVGPKARPVDVERGLFYLVEQRKADLAEQILST